MTEDEAKTKWCPAMAKESINRRDGKETCIGSACMAWRWKMTWDETGTGVEENVHGYCGLAGEP
jgi:hypothetical protein